MFTERVYHFYLDGKPMDGCAVAVRDGAIIDPEEVIGLFRACAPERITRVELTPTREDDFFTGHRCRYTVYIGVIGTLYDVVIKHQFLNTFWFHHTGILETPAS